MDTLTKEERSRLMSRIRSKGTGPERLLAAAMRRARTTGWRRHRKVAGVEVDFAWPRERVAVQVQGCFWHGCPDHYREPNSNREFWRGKVESNRARDARQTELLRSRGWLVLHVFECRLRPRGMEAVVGGVIGRGVVAPRRWRTV